MAKRTTINDVLFSSKTIDQVNTESIATAPVTKTTANNNPELVRKTYYYTPEIIKAVSVVAALQGKDKSQLVREILMDSELIKEYIEKIKTL